MTGPPARPVLAGLVAVVLLAGCTSAGGPTQPAEASPSVPTSAATPSAGTVPTPVPVPSASDGTGTAPGSGGGSAPNPGGGGAPIPVGPGAGAGNGGPEPTLVAPVPNLTGLHPVAAASLETARNGRDLAVKVTWWSGVAPCSVLAGVDVARDGNTVTLTVREGSAAAPDTACIEIAQLKGTVVDLGELEPGTYTVAAFGDASPVTVTIDG
jgi:hypothetical protein